jgi:hypothetical protein
MDLAPWNQSAWMSTAQAGKDLLFTEGDLLGDGVSLAADAFGDLLDFTAGFQEGSDLRVDRFAGFDGRSRLGFGLGGFDAHGCN